jgi:hypothetical protein
VRSALKSHPPAGKTKEKGGEKRARGSSQRAAGGAGWARTRTSSRCERAGRPVHAAHTHAPRTPHARRARDARSGCADAARIARPRAGSGVRQARRGEEGQGAWNGAGSVEFGLARSFTRRMFEAALGAA